MLITVHKQIEVPDKHCYDKAKSQICQYLVADRVIGACQHYEVVLVKINDTYTPCKDCMEARDNGYNLNRK